MFCYNQNMSKKTAAITNLLAQGTQEEFSSVFYNEISQIMRGFGDAELKYQNRDAVLLTEKIVQSQVRGILQEAIDVAVTFRGKQQPRPRDFEFLMRKNPTKALRLKKYLKDLQFFKKHVRSILGERYPATEEDAIFDISDDDDSETELIEKYDDEKTRRVFRADRISQILSAGTQYQEYNEARRTSFLCRNSNALKNRMREFLRVPADLILSPKVITILAYLANETIATLVDYCILTRLNSSNRQVENNDRVSLSGASYQMLHLCPEVVSGRGLDGVKSITVQEINEAMRRHNLSSSRSINVHIKKKNIKQRYLAL